MNSLLRKQNMNQKPKTYIDCTCLLTTEQALKYLNTTEEKLSKARREGLLFALKLNEKHYLYPKSEIEKYKIKTDLMPEVFEKEIEVEIGQKDAYTLYDVTQLLNVDERSINRYCKDNRLKKTPLTKKRSFYFKRNIVRFLKNCILDNIQTIEKEIL